MIKLNDSLTNKTFIQMFDGLIDSMAWIDRDWNTVEIDEPRLEDASNLIFISKSNKKNSFGLYDIKNFIKYEVADSGIVFEDNKEGLLMLYMDEQGIYSALSNLRTAGYID